MKYMRKILEDIRNVLDFFFSLTVISRGIAVGDAEVAAAIGPWYNGCNWAV